MSLFREERILRTLFGVWTAAALLLHVSTARAGCGDSDGVRCFPDLIMVAGVVWSGDGFVAVGQLRTPNATSGLVLLRLGRGGQLRDAPVAIPLPSGVTAPPDKTLVGEARKIIGLPDGGLIVLGQITLADETQLAWVMKLAANGTPVWNKAFAAEPGIVTIFHSGLYDRKGERLIVVGRRTSGFDEGKCSSWSQSVVLALKMSNGQPEFRPLYSGASLPGAYNRQAILDIAETDRPNAYVVTGFASAPNSTRPGECQDNISVRTLTLLPPASQNAAGASWELSTGNKIGSDDANEVAYAIKRVGSASYLVAGYGKDLARGAPAAQAFRVKLAPAFAVESSVSSPFPPDGSDKDGGDRFRAILALADKEHFVLVGSGSNGKKSPNQAIWQTVQSDLKRSPPIRQFKNQGGSDIFDAALSDAGKVFAVGKWTDDARLTYGWAGYLDELPGSIAPDSRFQSALPDRLAALSNLPFSGDSYRLPQISTPSGQAYLGRDLSGGKDVNLTFSITSQRTLRISARPEAGDLDLALLNQEKRPIAFSNFKGGATELIIATLVPGEYTLSILGNTNVKSYEVRLEPFAEADALAAVQKLGDEQREKLANALISAGYSCSPETNIAFGSETLRSIYAVRQSAGDSRPISITSLDPLVKPVSSVR
jgi:hypothetical protein